jgi:hypothetical protein
MVWRYFSNKSQTMGFLLPKGVIYDVVSAQDWNELLLHAATDSAVFPLVHGWFDVTFFFADV